MRSVTASVVVHRPIEAVWDQLGHAGTWQAMMQAFAGWGSRLRCELDSQSSLALGSKFVISKPNGSVVVRWRVSACAEPTIMQLSGTSSIQGLTTFHVLLKLQLESLDTDKTQVVVTFVAMFSNSFVEVASLMLPVRGLYTRRMHKALQTLRDAT